MKLEVIHRLVDLEETDPEILREVEQALASRLRQQVPMRRRRVAGVRAIEGILRACDGRVAGRIMQTLATHDRNLAEQVGPPALDFDGLTKLDAGALKVVFEAAEPELAMAALIGAPPMLIDRVLRWFPPADARTIRHKLDHPGPIRLSDVENARRQIAELARRLAVEGRIRLSPKLPVTVC